METLDFTKLKPANYNRKSSESEDKQALSNDSQEQEAKRVAAFHRLPPFVKVYKEAKSAKAKLNRPEFSEMLQLIHAGQIDSIVCWKPDRLARNMSEGGQIIDLLSSGRLKAIITHDKVYYPHDNVLMLSVEFGQGHQFVKDLSANVKRGQKTKASLGVPHGVATLGFLNDRSGEKGNRKWLVDELRLGKIKTLFDLFLTGTYSAGRLHRHAAEVLKLTTAPHKRSGDRPIVASRMYTILTDPVYAGFFYYGGVRYELDQRLPRLITEDQHEKVKRILGRRFIPRFKSHTTAFAGFIASDKGDFVGPDVKIQVICDCKKKIAYLSRTHCPWCGAELSQLEHPKYLQYVFYYNVRKKKMRGGYRTIAEDRIWARLDKEVVSILTFSSELVAWSKRHIDELHHQKLQEASFEQRVAEEADVVFEQKKARLRAMLRDNHITEDEYHADLNALQREHAPSAQKSAIDWYARMNEIADLTECMRDVFAHGSVQQKRNTLSKLGSNLIWDEESLRICNTFEVDTLIRAMQRATSENPEFEPENISDLTDQNGVFRAVSPSLLRAWEDVRLAILTDTNEHGSGPERPAER